MRAKEELIGLKFHHKSDSIHKYYVIEDNLKNDDCLNITWNKKQSFDNNGNAIYPLKYINDHIDNGNWIIVESENKEILLTTIL